jgi:hypothetical protein
MIIEKKYLTALLSAQLEITDQGVRKTWGKSRKAMKKKIAGRKLLPYSSRKTTNLNIYGNI